MWQSPNAFFKYLASLVLVNFIVNFPELIELFTNLISYWIINSLNQDLVQAFHRFTCKRHLIYVPDILKISDISLFGVYGAFCLCKIYESETIIDSLAWILNTKTVHVLLVLLKPVCSLLISLWDTISWNWFVSEYAVILDRWNFLRIKLIEKGNLIK